MAGAAIGELALGGVVDPVKGRDEYLVLGRVTRGEPLVDMLQQSRRRFGMTGMAVCQAVQDCHHDGGRRAMAADVGDQETPAAAGKLEEIVIIAAGPLRGLIVRR